MRIGRQVSACCPSFQHGFEIVPMRPGRGDQVNIRLPKPTFNHVDGLFQCEGN